MTVTVIGPVDKGYRGSYIDTTSRAEGWSRSLSPFFLGPVSVPYGPTMNMIKRVDDRLATATSEAHIVTLRAIREGIGGVLRANNVENAWQYSKVYDHHDASGEPIPEWFQWRHQGFRKQRAVRYPYGKGAVPLYSWFDGKRYDYIEARKHIYVPLYSEAVRLTPAFRQLQGLAMAGNVVLWDFDGYDHRSLGMSFDDVMNCRERKMGHAFVLAMMLEGIL